jgi:GAF domain-containing protein
MTVITILNTGIIVLHLKEMKMPALTLEMISLLSRIRELAEDAPTLKALERGVVEAISERLPHYNWTGFYWLDPGDAETLVLGAFVGEPTPHVRIPVSQGICGAAVAAGETVVVDNVNADPRYLSCSIKTKSEIVVPIRAHGKVVGEIDIDSHTPAAFTEIDRVFVEEAARIVGAFIEERSGKPI